MMLEQVVVVVAVAEINHERTIECAVAAVMIH